jgi:protein-disulfide isomerase
VIDRIRNSPWALAGALLLSALLGAGAFALFQMWVPAGVRDRAAVERVVRNYILANPEILPEAMDRLQMRESARAVKAVGPGLTRPFAGAWAGNPDGDVTVITFMDYNCGYCRASLPAIAELLRRDPKVRIVYREYPVLGAESGEAARWALAAAEQGKFPAFHDALFAGGQVSQASISAAAARAGVDVARARQAMATPAIDAEIAGNHAFGTQLRMTGTPAWVIGDRVISGALDYAELADAVEKARAKS